MRRKFVEQLPGDIDKALTYTPDANTPVLLDSKWKEKAARSLLVSLTTAPPVPAITIHGGSVDLYNANNFSVKPHREIRPNGFWKPREYDLSKYLRDNAGRTHIK